MSSPLVIGTRTHWIADDPEPFVLKPQDRLHHVYVVGKTGVGKTTLLRNLIVQDLEAGAGVGLIDPHGDLAEEILGLVPRRRTEEVVYVNPADRDRSVAVNLLEAVPEEEAHLAVDGIVSAFRAFWGDSWGPRLEYLLAQGCAALVEGGRFSILALPRLFSDDEFRERLGRKLRDPILRLFWTETYPSWDLRYRREAIAPIENKLGRLLGSAPLRNMLCQVRNRFDFDFLLARRRIFIANLSKGRLGEANANLFGSLLVSRFALAALRRARLPVAERHPFFLYMDEFQSFSTDVFRTILSEARKYGLGLVLAHQYLDQLTEELQRAVFGNVGTLIAFRVGDRDAAVLEAEFGEGLNRKHLVDLRKHEVGVRLLTDGLPGVPFRGITLPPAGAMEPSRREVIRRRSSEKYSRPRAEVEAKIRRWLRRDDEDVA